MAAAESTAEPASEDVAEDDAADHRAHVGLAAAVVGLVLALAGLDVVVGQVLAWAASIEAPLARLIAC